MTEGKKMSTELTLLKKEFEDFVYIISHDVKNPPSYREPTTWIEEDLGTDVDNGILDNFNLLKNRVGRLENMINALVELSQTDRTKWTYPN
jgi:light-regulated signal transduction histidine kinase (bacteriophytochrome)